MQKNTLQFMFTPAGLIPECLPEHMTEKDVFWKDLFEADCYGAMYRYGLDNVEAETASAVFVKNIVRVFWEALTRLPELEMLREKATAVLTEENREKLLRAVPFVVGAEHVTGTWLEKVFKRLNEIYQKEMTEYEGTVALYLEEKNQKLHIPERIFLHLVESKDGDYPFAFMATYASRQEDGKVKHMPLKYALTEYKQDREKLLKLLSCLNKAAEVSELIAGFMESGEMFYPLQLTTEEAYEFLKQVEAIEAVGIMCRIPNWWRKRANSVSVTFQIGEEKPAMLGFDTLVSLKPQLTVEGEILTQAEIEQMLSQTEGLALLKGKWVEVNHQRLQKLLKQMEESGMDLTLMDALRMQMGTKEEADVGALITNGQWLGDLLQKLRHPKSIRQSTLPKSFQATLRPYQKSGFTWLNYMDKLGFGACLADDMGLGKTVQVLAYLEKIRTGKGGKSCLLVVPASLLGNWEKEAEKFAPSMDYQILHGKTSQKLGEDFVESDVFLTITTYGMVARIQELKDKVWDCIILDEAQAIKNPLTMQTREIKKLQARMRIAMTGTPIENDLTNLWSLFDFLNKGLMGTSKEFKEYCKDLTEHPEGYSKLRMMISPFMLRRLKTDKTIITDLPEKIEMLDYAALSKKQVVLYRKIVADMEMKLAEADGIQRKGIVLSTIVKLKQICNHPDQYLGQQAYVENESGKFAMLREICETIYEKRERVLVFTQFKEITEYLEQYLETIFHAKGYVLHGGTPVKERSKIVEAFQGEKYVPFLVLSVKAGGTGLNLTKASHVIHFDRWWNPAVENQATDRAFRIGQKNNVIVHKLVCKNTIEEKIDAIISGKTQLAQDVIGSGGESWITELGNAELMNLLRLE